MYKVDPWRIYAAYSRYSRVTLSDGVGGVIATVLVYNDCMSMDDLPLFPLQTVLFPGMPLHLHIFEPRYRLMMRRCLEGDRRFGVALIKRGREAQGPLPEPVRVGCTAYIVQDELLGDGRMYVTAMGMERFTIRELTAEGSYWQVTADPRPLKVEQTPLEAGRLRQDVRAYLRMIQRTQLPDLELDEVSLPEDALALVYFTAGLLQLPAPEKQPLLELDAPAALLVELHRLVRRELALLPLTGR